MLYYKQNVLYQSSRLGVCTLMQQVIVSFVLFLSPPPINPSVYFSLVFCWLLYIKLEKSCFHFNVTKKNCNLNKVVYTFNVLCYVFPRKHIHLCICEPITCLCAYIQLPWTHLLGICCSLLARAPHW